jgi:hypothetical protein|nr:hypothetical protein [Rhodoferax sp.]
MDVQVSGRLNILEARGPFNKELVIAGDAVQEALDAVLNAQGRWGTVLVFKENALASPEAVAEIASIVKRRVDKGIRPVAIGLVVTPDVEGGAIMQSHYLAAYAKAGIPGKVFPDVEKAKLWVVQAIG